MKSNQQFPDEDLIDEIYNKSIQIDKPSQITDWSTWHQWINSTNQLSHNGQMAYRIAMLHNQVINGGFIQYFDNRYGIFAYETLNDLLKIDAKKTWKLLSKALSIINPDHYTGQKFLDYIYFHQYESSYKTFSEKLELLDDDYYTFDGTAEPIRRLASYFRNGK
jgi:hypothetical protein